MSDNIDNKNQQIDIAERLQLKLLRRFEKLIDDDLMTPTDAATLARLLMSNGWNIDPSKVPARLRDVLTTHFDPTKLDEDAEFNGAN
jgi:hypothetical protein